MTDPNELRTALEQFIATTQYFYNPLYPQMKYTDGVNFLVNNAGNGAYWLLDIIGTEVEPLQRQGLISNFVVIKLEVSDSQRAVLNYEDGDYNPLPGLPGRLIAMTDFPEGEWAMWLIDGILILPSEY